MPYQPRLRTRDLLHLSLAKFKKSWPDIQAASDHPLRWDVPSEVFTYSLRQTANMVTIRDDKAFVNAVYLLREELTGEPDDNLITFYLQPKLLHRTWQTVPWKDGAAEILVYDAEGPLLPVIPFEELLREDLQKASPNKANIMGVQALSLHWLLAKRAKRQVEDAPLIFRVKPESSTPTLSAAETFTPASPVPAELAPNTPQPPQITSPRKIPLPKRSRVIQDPYDAEADPPPTGVSTSRRSSRLILDAEDNVQGAFIISLDLVDRSVQQSVQDISVQMKEFLIQRFHRSPRLLLYLPFPALVNIENHRLLETLVLEELFNGKNFPGIASLKLVKTSRTRHEYTVSKAGTDYPYRGRGPVSSQTFQPSAIDSCLVAARLLDVGRLAADTLGETIHRWKRTLSDFGQQCIEAIDEPWEVYTSDISIELRDAFYNDAVTVYNRIVNGDALDESMTTGGLLVTARNVESYHIDGQSIYLQDMPPYSMRAVF
ncbi:hypothetical protein MMC27_003172 [Xylographa pallens]|nr:hypothetical protein [Xylographa pallens]